MSHWESTGASDEWFTPQYIFDALGCRFDLDVAAPAGFTTHVPADLFITANSLETQWRGFVWMNPPFGGRNGLTPWLERFTSHGDGIALVPDRTSAPWFQWAFGSAQRALFIAPKVKFERPDGSIGKSPSTGTVLLSMGERGAEALKQGHINGLGMLAEPQSWRRYLSQVAS
tara:strand:- start:765 stop:1280 length:516 start_codon:yes stop_codon:yes gene_type:complete